MQHFKEHCSKYKAASCTTQKYTMLPADHVTVNAFDFDIKDIQSCGFVGVDTRKKFLKDK
jgi:hypothetical protein